MAKAKEKKEWKAMRVNGVLGWVHKLVMLITFPFRRFLLIVMSFFIALVVLTIIPVSKGIPLRDVYDWYKIKLPAHEFIAAKDKTIFSATNGLNKIKRSIRAIAPKVDQDEGMTETEDNVEEVRFVSWNVAEFRKAKYEPTGIKAFVETNQPVEYSKVNDTNLSDNKVEVVKRSVDSPVKKEYDIQENTEADVTEDKVDHVENIDGYYTKLSRRDLVYLEVPEIINGRARVSDANGIYVADQFIYLYGIYSNPQRYDVAAAKAYLADVLRDRNVHCEVVSLVEKVNLPAALCFVEGKLINKLMVENNFAQNVALK